MRKTIYLIVLGVISSCGKEPIPTDARVAYIRGTAVIEHVEADGSKKTRPARTDEKVHIGDAIVTSDAGTVILEVGGATIEIQKNSRFVYERGGDDKQVYLQSGNAWTSVQKLNSTQKFSLRTPTTVAGVRGTKFFTFTDGKNTGTCHCEGKIALTNTASGKEEINDGDYLEYYRGNKAIKVRVEDIRKMGIPIAHNHSELDNSAVGKKDTLTPAQWAKINEQVEKKFAALK